MQYEDWLKEFIKDKTLIAILDQSDGESTHDIHRYLDQEDRLWETAIRLDGKVMIRQGTMGPDGFSIIWSNWEILEAIQIPE